MKVWPANTDMRKVMNHPIAGKFRDVGAADWPEDTYTFRRMREGSIVTENPNTVETTEQVPEPQPEPPPPAPPEPEPDVKAETPVAAPKRKATSKEK